jgi:hypothetical protein
LAFYNYHTFLRALLRRYARLQQRVAALTKPALLLLRQPHVVPHADLPRQLNVATAAFWMLSKLLLSKASEYANSLARNLQLVVELPPPRALFHHITID